MTETLVLFIVLNHFVEFFKLWRFINFLHDFEAKKPDNEFLELDICVSHLFVSQNENAFLKLVIDGFVFSLQHLSVSVLNKHFFVNSSHYIEEYDNENRRKCSHKLLYISKHRGI